MWKKKKKERYKFKERSRVVARRASSSVVPILSTQTVQVHNGLLKSNQNS